MSVRQYRDEVDRRRKEIAKLNGSAATEAKKASSERESAARYRGLALRSNSISGRKSYESQADRFEANALRHQRSAEDHRGKAAAEEGRLATALKNLASAESREQKMAEDAQKRAERLRAAEMDRVARRLSAVDSLQAAVQDLMKLYSNPPDRITVLFLASNPVIPGGQLKLDEEVRSIHSRIRSSEFRDSVHLESRWAVRPLDLFQALNECTPTVVHFSGHGTDQDEIVFQGDDGQPKFVSKDAIVQSIAAVGGIRLVFFNTCFSSSQAESIVAHIPAAIGMNAAVDDEVARVFAAAFYSAIGFGLSLRQAFDQASLTIQLEGMRGSSTPQLYVGEGLSADEMYLVAPTRRS